MPSAAASPADAAVPLTVASLIVPSIVVSLGIALEFRLVDDTVKALAETYQIEWLAEYPTAMGLFTSGLGAHLTWTLPFGLLIMFAVFNRFPAPTRKPRATSAPRPGRLPPCGAAADRAVAWSAWRCSASPCPGTRSRVPSQAIGEPTPCRWNSRA